MRTLIAYGTKYGTTNECAKKLSSKLNGEVVIVNLKDSKPNVADFDQIIIGSSVYVGSIHKHVKEFCVGNQVEILKKKLGLFICSMEQGEKGETELDLAYPLELQEHATSRQIFGGELLFSKMNFFERLIIKQVSKSDKEKTPVDGKTDVSEINEENIGKMAQAMNG